MNEQARLEEENGQVLNLDQALLGAITEDFIAVSLEYFEKQVRINFVLARDSDEAREEVDDILFEFEALQERNIPVTASVMTAETSLMSWLTNKPGRLVFLRKARSET